MKVILSIIAACNLVVGLALFHSASQRFPQVTAETEQMTASTGGRQVSIMAPAPTANLQWGIGLLSAATGAAAGVVALGNGVQKDKVQPEDIEEPEEPEEIEDETQELPGILSSIPIPLFGETKEESPEGFSSPLLDGKTNPQLASVIKAGALLVCGPQGSGKSTLVGGIIAARLQLGHRVIVFNHHAAYQEYAPLKVYGAGNKGLSFDEIQEGLVWLKEELERRYEMRSQPPNASGKWEFESEPITVIFEEFSSYSRKLPDPAVMGELMGAFTEEIRKACIFPILTVHSLSARKAGGGVTGIVTELKNNFPRIILGNKPGPDGEGMVPSGFCEVFIPGQMNAKNVKVPNRSEMVPNPDKPLDFTSLVKTESIREYAKGKPVLTVSAAMEGGFSREEALKEFERLGQSGLALLNKEKTAMRLTDLT